MTAYSPVAYQAYSGSQGWYPGYWLNRATTNLFGQRRTYVANYPAASYAVAYAPTYQTVARPVALTAYRPVSSCSSCSTCFSNPCGCGTTVMRASCCDPCQSCIGSCSTCGSSPCSCGSSGVSSAVYDSGGTGCASCGVPASSGSTAPSTYSDEPRPDLAPEENPPVRPTIRDEDPDEADDSQSPDYPDESSTRDANASFRLEPPELFNPRDRVTAKPATPIRTAVLQAPVRFDQTGRVERVTTINRAQAERDASVWASVD